MKPILIVCVVLAFFFAEDSNSAYIPAGELAKRLQAMTANGLSSRDAQQDSEAIGYVLGAVDAMNGRQFCIPSSVTRDEVIQTVTAYLEENSQFQNLEASFFIMNAFRDKYACKPIP